MPYILRTAKFTPGDAPASILADLACPACGHQDHEIAHKRVNENKLRFFCDCCGAFVIIRLSDEQANAIRRWSGSPPAVSEPAPRTFHA